MEPHEYDEILRTLVRIAIHQESINQDLREFNAQQLEINRRLEITQAQVETLLTRMLQSEANGQDA